MGEMILLVLAPVAIVMVVVVVRDDRAQTDHEHKLSLMPRRWRGPR